MRLKLNEILAKLYVYRELTPYDTAQWSVFNDDAEADCSAEVRLEGYADEIEAIEAQVIVNYDNPRSGLSPVKQICYIKAAVQKQKDFSIVEALVNGDDKSKGSIYNWGEKSLKFFMLIAQELEKEELPDFEELEKIAFAEHGYFADRMGDGGKSPKINSEQLLKAGRGF